MEAVDPFEAERPRLTAIAYRMLGSRAEAEDVVQEAWLRFSAAPRGDVTHVPAYLCTVVTRLCLDQLKSARARREAYVGPWLPEPLPTGALEPTDRESISTAFLLLLERLSPQERAAFVLHEAFDYSHAEVAELVGATEAACRQWFHRAQQHLAAARPRFARSREEHQRLLGAFLDACSRGDVSGLRALLADGVVALSDGGGKAQAALNPVRGPDAVARLFIGLARKMPAVSAELIDLNGWPAVVLREADAVYTTVAIETDGERIHAVHSIRNPDKLARL